MTDTEDSEYLNTRQVAEQYGFPEATLRYWRFNNTGPASFKRGRRVVYRRSEVEGWIRAQEQATARGGIRPDRRSPASDTTSATPTPRRTDHGSNQP